MAITTIDKNCGCETLLVSTPATDSGHTTPLQLVHHTFLDWFFEKEATKPAAITWSINALHFGGLFTPHLPQKWSGRIFHPPLC